MIIVVDGVQREMTDAEKAAYEKAAAEINADRERVAEEQAAALKARKAPLRRLGLTDDEINIVLGV